jgi:2-polyprenyl-3-methyl-5-hydroxy-6-metoxy-1,4-benzoquinol methylase
VQADLAELPDLGEAFDAVVANVVFEAIPQWVPAMRNCIQVLRPGGLLVFSP